MEAERLGHHVVDGVALDVPATAAAFKRRFEEAFDRQQLHVVVALAGVTGLLVVIGQWVDLLVFPALLAFALLVIVVVGIGQQRILARGEQSILAGHPWQVWPCRVQVLTRAEAQALPGRKRTGATAVRVQLLARNGAVVRSGKTRLPTKLYGAMTDDIGTVWICGDLRQPYLVAAPGGADWAYCHPDAPPSSKVHITIRI